MECECSVCLYWKFILTFSKKKIQSRRINLSDRICHSYSWSRYCASSIRPILLEYQSSRGEISLTLYVCCLFWAHFLILFIFLISRVSNSIVCPTFDCLLGWRFIFSVIFHGLSKILWLIILCDIILDLIFLMLPAYVSSQLSWFSIVHFNVKFLVLSYFDTRLEQFLSNYQLFPWKEKLEATLSSRPR